MASDRFSHKINSGKFKSNRGMFSIKLMIIIVIANILLISCGPKLTPTETVEAYFEAITNKDIKQISKYIVDGDKYYKDYENLSEIAKKQSLEQLKSASPERIEVTKEVILGDSAKVTVSYMGNDYVKTGVYQLKLRKIGGKWKIDLGFRQK